MCRGFPQTSMPWPATGCACAFGRINGLCGIFLLGPSVVPKGEWVKAEKGRVAENPVWKQSEERFLANGIWE